MAKPKVISDSAVRITLIRVRSALRRVRWKDMPVRQPDMSVRRRDSVVRRVESSVRCADNAVRWVESLVRCWEYSTDARSGSDASTGGMGGTSAIVPSEVSSSSMVGDLFIAHFGLPGGKKIVLLLQSRLALAIDPPRGVFPPFFPHNMTTNARRGPAQDQIRQEAQAYSDDDSLERPEGMQLDHLIHKIHARTQQQHAGNRHQPFAQTGHAADRIVQQGPQIGLAVHLRIAPTIA